MKNSVYKIGLVLEGGGMRSVFTAGLLDCWLDYGIEFPYVIGTSAGATTGLSYISKQRGRTRFSNIDLLKVRNYVGWNSIKVGQGVMDLNFLFYEYPNKYYPFDFRTYSQSPTRFVVVASNATTGKVEYFEEKNDENRFLSICRASCSLPLLCPMGNVDGVPMVDGGVCDSIPFRKALDDGCQRVVVVLTQEASYRKSRISMWIPPIFYSKFPLLRRAIARRNKEYNASLDELRELEKSGVALVIRPTTTCGVGRTTNDIEKLEQLYDEGYRHGLDAINEILKLQ